MPPFAKGKQHLSTGLQSQVAWLSNGFLGSYQKVADFYKVFDNIQVSPALLVNTNERVAQALKPHLHLALKVTLAKNGIGHVDETGWTVKDTKEWAWIFSDIVF